MVITMTSEQSKMARAALGWSLTRLATEANIGRATAARFELGEQVQNDTVKAIRAAFAHAGIDMIDPGKPSKLGGAGVRFQAG
jgi:transcriptional regulator with XRE-family HTH domain